MIIEIIQILFVFAVAGGIWILKGGSPKGFVKFILSGFLFIVGLDHFNRWQGSRGPSNIHQKQDIRES